MKISPNSIGTIILLASTYFKEAEISIQKANKIDPNNVDYYINLGSILNQNCNKHLFNEILQLT